MEGGWAGASLVDYVDSVVKKTGQQAKSAVILSMDNPWGKIMSEAYRKGFEKYNIECLADRCPDNSWVLGRLKKNNNKNKLWWNNGQMQLMSEKCPGPDWVPGMIKTRSNTLRFPYAEPQEES